VTTAVRPNRAVTIAIRVAVLACAAAVVALLPALHGFAPALVGICAALAVAFPDRVGSGPACAVSVVVAGFGYRGGADISVVHALVFAVALYSLHEATSLAASVPLTAAATVGTARRWIGRSLPGLLAAVLAAVLMAVVGTLSASLVLDVVAVAAVVVVLAAALALLRMS
jgi:hypothetical protein